jgi:CDP-paratose synthetase
MKILITGIGGYLGSQLANALITEHELAGTVRSGSKLERIDSQDRISFIDVDKSDWAQQVKQFKPDVVINTAALYGRKGELLSELIHANIAFPQQILECIEHDAVFINCGTSLPNSVSSYAMTKNQFVDLAKEYCKSHGIQFVNLRLEHFFGANDDPTKFTTYLVKACLKGESIKLTQCEQVRDFIYMPDLLSAFKAVILNIDKLDKFEHIDVGSGFGVLLKEFVGNVIRYTGFNGEIGYGAIPYRENEAMYSVANIERLKSFGWMPMYNIENAINEYIQLIKVDMID